ncbi:MAG: RNA methyltransferase [Actinomycetota bacterium]|nr:RNA methyltransferase [Actinomycetota bacterium]
MPVIQISDVAELRLADYSSLTDVALRTSFESEHGLYIAESVKVITRALRAGHTPRSVLMSNRWLPRMGALLEEIESTHPSTPIFIGDESDLEAIAGFHVHRGALAAMHRPALPLLDELIHEGRQRLVILDGIVDHTNIGAIFRSVAGMGADSVLLTPQCADPLYRRSVRVSMGSVFQVPWTRIESWATGIARLHELGFTIAALALTADSQDLASFAADAPDRLAIVLGSEGDGLSSSVIADADVVLRIPMSGGVDSLNVAAASAVALWALRLASES